MKQGGRLVLVAFHNGDFVKAGSVVARIDPIDLLSTVREDEAAVASNRASLDNAKAAYEKQLTSTKTTINSAKAAYEQQVAQSESTVQSARAALKSANESLSEEVEGDREEQRTETQASLDTAQANFKKAKTELERYKQLHNAGAISDSDMDTYQNNYDTAEASLKSAKAAAAMQERGNRRQDIAQSQQKVLQAEETLRQAIAARATDKEKKADLEAALAGVADNKVKLAQIKSAQATLNQSLATLAIAKQAIKDAVLTSPISGFAYNRSAEPGQIVTSGTTLINIVSLDNIYYEPAIPNSQMDAVHLGQPVQVNVDTYPSKTFLGSITRIYPQSSSSNRSVSIRVSISNSNRLLRPGNYASGIITTALHRHVILVPSAAVQDNTDASGSYVYVVENGIAHQRAVTKGITSAKGDIVEVKGISAGSQVIVDGLTGMADGQKVTSFAASTDTDR
jgi:RND family efflux transporter MFP subunit